MRRAAAAGCEQVHKGAKGLCEREIEDEKKKNTEQNPFPFHNFLSIPFPRSRKPPPSVDVT